MTLTYGQERALDLLERWWKEGREQVFKLSGYAGTGKSTIIKMFADRLGITGEVCYAAYTGKATQVLVRKGLPARTIHRLIYEIDDSSKKLKFKKRKEINALGASLIVIDEASMVDTQIFSDLTSFGIRIVVVGDPGQLPPIMGKSVCLSNPDIVLTEIVRQAADNPIIALATYVRSGGQLKQGTFNGEIPIVSYNDLSDQFLAKADQVICGTNAMRQTLNNRFRQFTGHYDVLPEVGEKLISLKNLWSCCIDDNPIVNGTTGFVTKIIGRNLNAFRMLFRPDYLTTSGVVDSRVDVFFGREPEFRSESKEAPVGVFDFGYAITTHKSQGSEWGKVVVVVDRDWGDMQAKWLYTSVTRAVDRLVVALK